LTRVVAYSQLLVKSGVERSYLLGRERLKNLAECRSLEELASQLKDSPYAHLIRDVQHPTAAVLQQLFKKEFVRLCKRIMDFSPKHAEAFIRSYLRYLEIENLKILIKMKNIGVPSDSILSTLNLYVEEIFGMKEKFVQAARAEDVNAVIGAFRNTIYGPILSEGLTRYREVKSTRFFDFSLDRAYHDELLLSAESLPRREREIALLMAGPKVDAFNIMVAFRSKFLGFPPHLTFWAITHRFYRLSEKQVRSMVLSDSISSMLNYVKESFYGRFLVSRGNIEELITDFERGVNRFILKSMHEKRITDPFTIATPLEMVLRKENEMKNLISISSGIEFGWKPEDIISVLL